MQSEPQDFWYTPSPSKIQARNETLNIDLEQKLLQIQRIADEAKLSCLDIKKEEKIPSLPPSSTGRYQYEKRMINVLHL